MRTLIGCDVLLWNTHTDIDINEQLKCRSSSFAIGGYGNNISPAYVPNVNKTDQTTAEKYKTGTKSPTQVSSGASTWQLGNKRELQSSGSMVETMT